MEEKFFERVYQVVRQIPKGKVATYGQIALMIGKPKASKFVGYALHKNPLPTIIPCHRVVNRQGFLSGGFAFGGIEKQKQLLKQEGVIVNSNYCVNLENFQWKG